MCGIFGYSGNKPSLDKIKILGIYNETRGGDACGLFINNTILHGNGPEKTFHSFIEKNEIPEAKEGYTILGHTRKASIGGTNEKFTHPYAIRLDDDKRKLPSLVGVHNGTIYNWTELAKKYDVSTEDMNDSKALFSILAQDKFDVLKEYKGHAAILVCHPTDKNTLMVFKGASKESYKYINNLPSIHSEAWKHYYGDDFYSDIELETSSEYKEERPLYMYQESENSIYFSSLESALFAIGGKKENVFTVPINTLLKVKNGKIVDKIKINRDSKHFNNSTHYNTSESTRNRNLLNSHANAYSRNSAPFISTNNLLVDSHKDDDFHRIKNYVYYYRDSYFLNGTQISDGIYYIDMLNGKVLDASSMTEFTQQMAFVDGQPLVLFEEYEAALKVKGKPADLSRFTEHPIPTNTMNQMVFMGTTSFDMTFEPHFARHRAISIRDGMVFKVSDLKIDLTYEESIESEDIDCAHCDDTGIVGQEFCSHCEKGNNMAKHNMVVLKPETFTPASPTSIRGYMMSNKEVLEALESTQIAAEKISNQRWDSGEFEILKKVNNIMIKELKR